MHSNDTASRFRTVYAYLATCCQKIKFFMSQSFEHKPGGTQKKGFNTYFSIQVSCSHGSPSGVCFYLVHDLISFSLIWSPKCIQHSTLLRQQTLLFQNWEIDYPKANIKLHHSLTTKPYSVFTKGIQVDWSFLIRSLHWWQRCKKFILGKI
jgi:hypothetical protein